MRIAIVAPGFSAHSEDWAIPALQTQLCALAQEHELHVFSLRYPGAGLSQFKCTDESGADFPHRAIGGGQRFGFASLQLWRSAIWTIVRQHRQTPFDLLHAFWADEPGLVAVIAGARLKRPVVISFGGGELTYLPDIAYGTQGSAARRIVVRYAVHKAACLTAGSGYQLQLARRRGATPAKLQLAPLGVDCQRFRPQPNLSWERPIIVQAASLTPVKNQAMLLAMFSDVRQKMPGVCLRLAGGGPLRARLQGLAQAQELSHNIEWWDQVGYPEMANVFQGCHLYVQSSRHESQGMAVVEAMACGLPALGTPVGLLNEAAALPPQWDPAVLATQVMTILGDRSLQERLGRQARHYVEQWLSLAVTSNNFTKIYQELRA